LFLDEEFTVQAALVWHEGSRLNMEYRIMKHDGSLAASGYSVQLLTDGATGEPCFVSPPLLVRCREQWRAGEFR
jgi:acyl-CoA thioester hydrolase